MDEDINTAVGAVMAVLAILSVVARFYARHLKKAGYKWDDWLILVSLLAMIGIDVLAISGSWPTLNCLLHMDTAAWDSVNPILSAISINPTGPEAATVETQTHEYTPLDVLYTKLTWTTTVVYFSIISTTKLSILFLYNRLFSVDKIFRYIIIILGILVICFWIGCTVANLTNCVPTEYVWLNSLSDPRYCFNYNIYWFASGICEAVIDLFIILLPIKIVTALGFTKRQKVAVVSVFLLGAFVIVSGLLKAIFGYIPGSRQPSFSKPNYGQVYTLALELLAPVSQSAGLYSLDWGRWSFTDCQVALWSGSTGTMSLAGLQSKSLPDLKGQAREHFI
jgi:hypothetical protein